jgi:hypothetical protein
LSPFLIQFQVGIMQKEHGRLAQLVRAPPLQGGGRWFESNTAH